MSRKIFGVTVGTTINPEKLAEKLPSVGGSALPEVTGTDDGKVLAVSGGEWVAQEITIPDADECEPELPAVTEEDDGKVLAVSGGEWVAQVITIPDAGECEPELPAVTAEDDGKVLAVSGGEWVAQEITIPDAYECEPELPAVTEEDDGKVLAVSGGEWVAQEITIPDAVEELDAEKVKFSSNLETTVAIGNITIPSSGTATIPVSGKNLKEAWEYIFVKEKNPKTTQPSVSITFDQDEAYEVGTKITPSYKASFDPGSYTYGPKTGITVSKWTVTDSRKETSNAASGKFSELQITDDTSYTIKAEASHDAGAIPVTNRGNEYAAGKIAAGTKTKTSAAATGYRNSFYGTLENKNALTSDVIRGLTKSGKALADGDTFTVPVPVGALRVIIAYPATLKDVASIQDENSAYFNIAASFTLQTMDVNGANNYTAKSYKVYTLDFADPNGKANNFIVTI